MEHFNRCLTRLSIICAGTTSLHNEVEKLVVRYVGKPAAMVYGMGFATNSTTFSALIGHVNLKRIVFLHLNIDINVL